MTSLSLSQPASALDEQFNASDAELILRSSDGVDFAVYRAILQLASHVFRDMLSLPPPVEDHDSPTRTTIGMSEDAQSLRLLLHFTYPRSFCPEPDLSEIADIKRVAALALKYDITFMREAAETALIRFAQSKPDVAYVVAWRFEYPQALRAAARRSLEPFTESLDALEFSEVPASALQTLRKYGKRISVQITLISMQLRYGNFRRLHCHGMSGVLHAAFSDDDPSGLREPCRCRSSTVALVDETLSTEDDISVRAPAWWANYVRVVAKSASNSLRERHKLLLSESLSEPLASVLREAAKCAGCMQRDVRHKLEVTKTILSKEIERRVSQVPIEAPFMREDE
ncbi:unnamed protein product [Peniophora sp. CBMAI 1063]|nr:unnamed protein product [Peniophora sp. CBMAI 1063]